MSKHRPTPWEVEGRLPTRDEAAFAARTLSFCNGSDLDIWTDGNWPGDANDWLKPLASGDGRTTTQLLAEVEHRWPGSFWHLAKGRIRSSEPLFGFRVLFGSDEVLAEGEGDTAAAAVRAALAREATP